MPGLNRPGEPFLKRGRKTVNDSGEGINRGPEYGHFLPTLGDKKAENYIYGGELIRFYARRASQLSTLNGIARLFGILFFKCERPEGDKINNLLKIE